MRATSLLLLVSLAACPPAVPLTRCPALGETADWTGGQTVLACKDGALSLALSGTGPLVADGQTSLEVSLRVGGDFVLVGVPVTLSVSNGQIITGGASAASVDLLTGPEGAASAIVRVGTTPGALIVSGEVKAQPGALDAGTGQAKTTVFVTLDPAPVKALLITSAPARITAGNSSTLGMTGTFDDAMRIPAVGGLLEVCVQGSDLVPTPRTIVLGDGGVSSTTVAASSAAAPGFAQLRVCPYETGCAVSTTCKEQTVEIEAARKPIVRTLLSASQDPIVVGQTVTLNAAGYASTDFLVPAPDKSVLALCATGAALQDNWLQLDASGKASTRFLAGSGASLKISACPFGVDCAAPMLDPRCSTLERPVGPPADAIGSMALSLMNPLRRNQVSTLSVAAYVDSRRLVPTKAGVSVRLCFESEHVDGPTALFLDANGRATASIVPRQALDAGVMADGGPAEVPGWPWGPVVFTSCPYEVPCSSPTVACETLDAGLPQ